MLVGRKVQCPEGNKHIREAPQGCYNSLVCDGRLWVSSQNKDKSHSWCKLPLILRKLHSSHPKLANVWSTCYRYWKLGLPRGALYTRADTSMKSYGLFLHSSLRKDEWLLKDHTEICKRISWKSNFSLSWGGYVGYHCYGASPRATQNPNSLIWSHLWQCACP